GTPDGMNGGGGGGRGGGAGSRPPMSPASSSSPNSAKLLAAGGQAGRKSAFIVRGPAPLSSSDAPHRSADYSMRRARRPTSIEIRTPRRDGASTAEGAV